jgi:hypothetical protein
VTAKAITTTAIPSTTEKASMIFIGIDLACE